MAIEVDRNYGAGNCWAETYTIDPWGNLYRFGVNTTTQSAYVGCSQESGLTTQATTNNQLVNYGYDAAGNMISVPGIASYTYDAENHLISTAGYTYSYDGDGKRVMKSSGSSGTIYWYGASSMPLLETTLTGGGNFAYYYFNGRITNRREFAHFFTPDLYVHDALGNTNLASTTFPDGWDYSDYYPFGGEWVHQSVVGNHYKFTGKERDPESNIDNFGARFMTSSLGRFMSPNPIGGRPLVPQSWNGYSYVLNNPLNAVDPLGLDCVYLNDAGTESNQ